MSLKDELMDLTDLHKQLAELKAKKAEIFSKFDEKIKAAQAKSIKMTK